MGGRKDIEEGRVSMKEACQGRKGIHEGMVSRKTGYQRRKVTVGGVAAQGGTLSCSAWAKAAVVGVGVTNIYLHARLSLFLPLSPLFLLEERPAFSIFNFQ